MRAFAYDSVSVGDRFGIVTVTRGVIPRTRSLDVGAVCDCGTVFNPRVYHLLKGKTKSCGCVRMRKFAECTEAKTLPPGESLMRSLFWTYVSGARRRAIEFSLTLDDFRRITQSDCIYCGCEPTQVVSRERHNGDFVHNGVDRRDNALGYTVENSVACCGTCNAIKSSRPVDHLVEWARRFVFEQWGINVSGVAKVQR